MLLSKLGVGTAEVRLQVRGGLVRHLDALLEDRLGHHLPKTSLQGAGRLRSQHAAEVGVREFLDDLEGTLQRLQPSLHKVDVLQHDPTTVLGRLVQGIDRDLLLTLTHGDVHQAPVLLRDTQLPREAFDDRRGVRAWEKHEEERREAVRLLIGLGHVEGLLLHKVHAQVVHHKLRERCSQAVRPQDAEQEEAMEGLQVPAAAGQVRGLGPLFREPPLPAQRVLLHVLSEGASAGFEGGNMLEALQLRPLQVSEPSLRALRHGWRRWVWRRPDQDVQLLWLDSTRAHKNSQHEHSCHCELVRIEQTPPQVGEDLEGDDVLQEIHPQFELFLVELYHLLLLLLFFILREGILLLLGLVSVSFALLPLSGYLLLGQLLLRLFGLSKRHAVDSPRHHHHEGIEGVFVKGVHFSQVHHEEEEQGAAARRGPVKLRCLVDLRLCLLCHHDLLLHLVGGDLGILEATGALDLLPSLNTNLGAGEQHIVFR
mmetsp:Transcript_24875/g.52719  ORF Transcript_24875/g.52719 Transcript_24875/m.52719 type:complete len:483 (-) Transcript_24875:47-1495(-)